MVYTVTHILRELKALQLGLLMWKYVQQSYLVLWNWSATFSAQNFTGTSEADLVSIHINDVILHVGSLCYSDGMRV